MCKLLPRLGRVTAVSRPALLFIHDAGSISLLLFTPMSPRQALAFFAVHQALFGIYLGCSFAPNHKGMKMLTKDEEMDFLRRQVYLAQRHRRRARRHVARRPELADRAPPVSVDAAAELTPGGADRAGILRGPRPPYAEASLYRSYQLAMGHLHDVGASVEIVGTTTMWCKLGCMCRSIKTLRPPYTDEATPEDVTAAALQYGAKDRRHAQAVGGQPGSVRRGCCRDRRSDRAPARPPATATRAATRAGVVRQLGVATPTAYSLWSPAVGVLVPASVLPIHTVFALQNSLMPWLDNSRP